MRLEPANQRLVVDRWPRPGDQPFMLERPLAMEAETPIRLRLLVSGTCLALSCRLYNQRSGGWGLFVAEGAVRFANLVLGTRSASEANL